MGNRLLGVGAQLHELFNHEDNLPIQRKKYFDSIFKLRIVFPSR